jgi:nucleotide sugar dehydrogenase
MKIGIVGLGVVGQASSFGFKKLGHTVIGHDIKLDTKLNDLLDTEVAFICVPTPSSENGGCDTSIVESVVKDLFKLNYGGIVAIRSTVKPGTTEKLIKEHGTSICFVPEFLRERCAIVDFVENNNLLAVGTQESKDYDKIRECFGNYPKNHAMMSPTEAELIKYYHNSFSALRVVFANEFFEICKKMGANYTKVKNSLIHSSKLPDIYLDVNDSMRGYSSICWNKDIPAICQLAKELGLDLPMMSMIEPANNKFFKTPFEGTREHY